MAHENLSKGLGASQLLKAYDKEKKPPSAEIRTQHRRMPIFLALREWYLSSHAICTVLQANLAHTSSCSYCTTFDVIRAKPKLILHIISGAVFLLQSFVHGSWFAMFASSDSGIVQSLYIGLHCPTILAELAGILAICQWKEKQSIYNTDVVCATPCFAEPRIPLCMPF
jgi:hypothetical protein